MRNKLHIIRKIKIRNRIGIAMLLLLLISSMTLFQTAKSVSKELIQDYIYDYAVLTQREMVSGIEILADQINMFAVRMLVNQDIYALFNNSLISHEDRERELGLILDNFMVYRDVVGGVFIITDKGELYEYFVNGTPIEEPSTSYIKQIKETQTPLWGPILKDAKGDSYILLGRRYKNFYTGQQLGYLIFCIRETALSNIYEETLEDWGYSFILNESGYVISHPDKEKVGKLIIEEGFVDLGGDFDYQIKNAKDQPSLVVMQSFSGRFKGLGLNWRIVSNISAEYLFKVIKKINKYIILIQTFFGALIIFLSAYISSVVARPVTQLEKQVGAYAGGKIDEGFNMTPRDEIWALEKSFREMVVRIDQLIMRNNEEKEKQKEMELIALQAQINPHFIYNTLDAIGWMAKIKKQTEIERMVMALSSFFRISLHKGEQFIMVKEEIELIESYVTIEKMRFPDKFNIEFNIPEEMENCMMLKIVLQPLVENAIKHGLSEKRGMGNIYVNGMLLDGDLIFEVIDDGVGFNINSEKVIAGKGSNYSSGYGISNVNERIKLEYGEEYGLNIWSKKGEGTKAWVKLKAR